MGKKLKLGLLALPVIALSVLALAGTASAGDIINRTWDAQDPQTANIPYLAWAGNQVRIAKCFTREELNGPDLEAFNDLNPSLKRGKFRVEDWSGFELTGGNAGEGSVNTRQRTPDPVFLNDLDGDVGGLLVSPRSAFPREVPRLCFAVHVSSLKPGLAVIKLAVRDDLLGLFPGLDVLMKHQFLVIWLRSGVPAIREVANADFPDLDLGDPLGDGIFNLGEPFGANNGLVQVDVKGTAPMGNDFAGQWPGDSITLPDDWDDLANAYAFDDNDQAGGIPGSGSMRWDIHDDKTTASNHAGANTPPCLPAAGSVDAVDNCLGGPQDGQFSFLGGFSQPGFGDLFGPNAAVGPFDQLRPLNSLLSDGALNPDDAPMPPLRVDVRIAPGGVGGLAPADKDNIYVRDQSMPDSAPHNLYAPFYEALIPASRAGDNGQTSGVAGSFSNNFPGFLANYYDYWRLLDAWQEDPLRNREVCKDSAGTTLDSPTGPDHVAVYTDEHGQAFVQYDPDTGFNWATLNGACDLDLPANRSFTSLISATGIYPDQPVIWDRANKTSASITKTVNIAASKTLNCVPKGPMSMFCVETIRDIYGDLQPGVTVRFTRSPRGDIFPDSTAFGGFDTSDQFVMSQSADDVVVRTGPNGQAGVLIRETRNICIDVTAENLGSRQQTQANPPAFNPGVFRQAYINPFAASVLTACGDGTGTGGPTTPVVPVVVPPVVVPPLTTTVTLSSAPSAAASVVSLAGNPTPAALAPAAKAKAAKAAKATLSSAQLLSVKGNRYLIVWLKSSLNRANVKVTLIGKNGKVQRVVIRKVSTNRAVTVPNLKIGKLVKSVKISVVA